MLTEEIKSKAEEWKARIQALSEAVWEGRAKEQAVRDWLAGFNGGFCDSEVEKIYALYLLQHFIYFGQNEIAALLYALFRDHILYPIVQQCLDNDPLMDDTAIRQRISNAVTHLKIVPVGQVSESAAMLSYRLRQEAVLPPESIRNMAELFEDLKAAGNGINHVLLMDDFLGTGNQLCDTHQADVIRLKAKGIRVEYVALVAMQKGLNKVKSGNLFDSIRAVIGLDESYSLTETPCLFLEDLGKHPPLSEQQCIDIVTHYGSKLVPGAPTGYGDCGVMVGFNHNTQDNTLPIFWAKSQVPPWSPIFARLNKVYNFQA